MATSTIAVPRAEMTSLIRQVQSTQLFNRQLSSICQINGLKSTGVKAELQRRIVDLIQLSVNSGETARFYQIRQSVLNAVLQRPSPAKGPAGTRLASTPQNAQSPSVLNDYLATYNNSNGNHSNSFLGNGSYQGHNPSNQRANMPQSQRLTELVFKSSPFYRVCNPIAPYRTCEAMSQHRNSIIISIKLDDAQAQRFVQDKSLRILIFCATDNSGVQNIAFPHQSEIKVNGGDVKANLRGLKNKPGSTRPVDITNALRLRPANYSNNVEFTYALTQKKFYVVANMCNVTSVADLVSTISMGRRIPKDSVVAEFNKKAQDQDVIAMSQVLSLRCPLSYMRLDVPCRSISCTHVQCFDATSYLQLQEQGPQWLCPICNKPAPFDQLAVDEYVRNILDNTPKSLESVTIEPDGKWSTKSAKDEQAGNSAHAKSQVDDVDDLEISEISYIGNGRRFDTPKHPTPGIQTPVSNSTSGILSPSTTLPRGLGSTSLKRPAPTVIDLTFSSDEDEDDDDEPIQRSGKRTNRPDHRSAAKNGDSIDEPRIKRQNTSTVGMSDFVFNPSSSGFSQ